MLENYSGGNVEPTFGETSSLIDTPPNCPNDNSAMETLNASPESARSASAMADSISDTACDLSASCMTTFSLDDWNRTFRAFAAVFPPNSALAPEVSIEVYAAVTKEYSRKQLRAAAIRWLKTGTRFPFPADLIGEIEAKASAN